MGKTGTTNRFGPGGGPAPRRPRRSGRNRHKRSSLRGCRGTYLCRGSPSVSSLRRWPETGRTTFLLPVFLFVFLSLFLFPSSLSLSLSFPLSLSHAHISLRVLLFLPCLHTSLPSLPSIFFYFTQSTHRVSLKTTATPKYPIN